jgi:ribosomal protein L40E
MNESLKQKIQAKLEEAKAEVDQYPQGSASRERAETESGYDLLKWVLVLLDDVTKQIQEKAICGRCLDNEPVPMKGCRFNCETCKVRSKVSQYVYLPHVLGVLDGENKNEC